MPITYSIDDYVKSRPKMFTLESYIASRPKIMDIDEMQRRSMVAQAKKDQEEQKTLGTVLGDMVEQAGIGFLNAASMGMVPKPTTIVPENTAEGIAQSAGGLAGLMVGPAKLLKAPQRAVGGFLGKALPEVLGGPAGRVAAHFGTEIANMSMLGAMSDVTVDQKELAQNVKDWGEMGAIFGAAKMAGVLQHPVINWVLRQGAVRAFTAIAGHYPKDYLTKDNIPQVVWQEALNTIFVSHGISPQEILSGKYSHPEKAKLIRDITEGVMNSATGGPSTPLAVSKELFVRPVPERVPMNKVKIDLNMVSEKTKDAHKGDIQKGGYPKVTLDYDPVTDSYASADDNSALAAIRDLNIERMSNGEKLLDVVKAVVRENNKYTKTRLATPMELAEKLLGASAWDQAVVHKFQSADEFVMEVSEKSDGLLKSIGSSTDNTDYSKKLGTNQVLWRLDSDSHDYIPIMVGDNLKGKVVWKGNYLPTQGEITTPGYTPVAGEAVPPSAEFKSTKKVPIEPLTAEEQLFVNENQPWELTTEAQLVEKIKQLKEGGDPEILKEAKNRLTKLRKGYRLLPGEDPVKVPNDGLPFTNVKDSKTGIDYDKVIRNKEYAQKHGLNWRIIELHPDDYLTWRSMLKKMSSAKAEQEGATMSSLKNLVRLLRSGQQLDVPILDMKNKTFEGRNRAVAYKVNGDRAFFAVEFYSNKGGPVTPFDEVSERRFADATRVEPTPAPAPAPKYAEKEVSSSREFNLDRMHKLLVMKARIVKNAPEKLVPEPYLRTIEDRYNMIGLGTKSVDAFYRSLHIDDGAPRLKHVALMEQRLSELESADRSTLMEIFLQEFFNTYKRFQNEPLTGEFKKQQDRYEVAQKEALKKFWIKAKAQSMTDPAGRSELAIALTNKFLGTWFDVRYAMGSMEMRSKLPFFRIYRALSDAESTKKGEARHLMMRINEFSKATPEDQAGVIHYFNRMYEGKDPASVPLNDYQQRYVDAINELMAKMRGDIFDYKFRMWEEHVKKPSIKRDIEMQTADAKRVEELKAVKDKRVFRSQDSDETRAILDELFDVHQRSIAEALSPAEREPYVQEFNRLKQVAMQGNLGLIREDAYLPEIFEGKGASKLSSAERQMHIDQMTKTNAMIRLSNGKEMSLAEMQQQAVEGEVNLAKRLNHYVNSVLNLKHLSEPLEALDELARIFYQDFKEAKPNAFMRKTPEAKAYSLYDFLQLYATRLKGFPIKIGGLGRALKATQTSFFRSLVVRPALIMRNIPQRFVTVPNKMLLLSRQKFDKISDTAKDFFENNSVNEIEMVQNQYLELETDFALTRLPVIRTVWKWSGEVGKLYALSDLYNRRFVFAKVWRSSLDNITDYRNGKLPIEKLEQKIGINKMKTYEQREFRTAIQEGNDDLAACINARWQTVNSQWYYGRHQRSFNEMTAEGETMTNLLTWSKSMAQQTFHTAGRMVDGFERWKILQSKGDTVGANKALRQTLDATAQVVGLGIAGWAANQMLNTATLNHKGRYQAYGMDMFTWEMGGVTMEILNQTSQAFADIVSAAGSTKEDQRTAFENFAKLFDNVALRQLTPFMKSAFSVIESVTGKSYLSPVYSLLTKVEYGYPKGFKNVDRTFLERMLHGIMATDPNKSVAVKKWAFDHLQDMKAQYAQAKNSPEKEYLWLMIQKYEYLNDLFQRYTPYEAAKIRNQQMIQQHQKDFDYQIKQYEYNLMKEQYKK